MKNKIIKEDTLNLHKSADLLSQPVTAKNIKQLGKMIVNEMVKVATSKEGYTVMKELSKR